jgi:isoleucyl-tRNA synthetase
MADSYRRMRNTFRFLLGNLHGFDPSQHAVKPSEMVALDRWALARARQVQEEVTAAYRKYEFHAIYQAVHKFCAVDMGSLYLDVLKDRLYTTPVTSMPRRSGQTAMYHIAEAMVRWLAPILSFTAEEMFRALPGQRSESVFLEKWHELPEVPRDDLDWPALLELRGDVLRELEKLRDAGVIGAPLEAEVDIYATPAAYARMNALRDELRFLFITSEARVHKVETPPASAIEATGEGLKGVWLLVKETEAAKCVRCWHRRPDVGQNPEHPELCGRCEINLSSPGEKRTYA